jgi:hypothetical protein
MDANSVSFCAHNKIIASTRLANNSAKDRSRRTAGNWSERQDLNLRQPAPKAGALPS